MVRLRAVLPVALVAIIACGVSSTAPKSAASPGQPYSVLFIGNFSGAVATTLAAELVAVKAAADVLNKSGGIENRPITVDNLDDQGDPTKALALLQSRLGQQPIPDMVIPGNTSTEALAMLPALTRSQVFSFCSCNATSVNDPTKYPYIFSTAWPQADQANAIVQYVNTKGYKKLSVLTTTDAVGQAAKAEYAVALPKAGFTNIVYEQFIAGTVDVTPNLERLRQTNPDVVLVVGVSGANPPYVYNTRKKMGWTVPFIGDTGSSAGDISKLVSQDAMQGITLEVGPRTAVADPAIISTPQYKTFIAAIRARAGSTGITIAMSSYTNYYNLLPIVSLAAKQAKATDAVSLSKALENLTNQPATKPYVGVKLYQYSSTNHFAHLAPEDFAFVPAGPQTEGQYKF